MHQPIPSERLIQKCLQELNRRHSNLCTEMDQHTAAYLVPHTLSSEARFGPAIVDQAMEEFRREHPVPESELPRIQEVIRRLKKKDAAFGAVLGVYCRALRQEGHERAYERAMAATFPTVGEITPEVLDQARRKFATWYLERNEGECGSQRSQRSC
jgi:hypothetical protein